MRHLFLLSCVVLFYGLASGQNCTLTINNAPELRGFRLGMNYSDIKGKVASIEALKPDENGQSIIRLADKQQAGVNLDGASKIELTFIDAELLAVSVSYDNSIKWESVREFSFALQAMLNLPPAWGQSSLRDSENMQMRCKEFSVIAWSNEEGSSVTIKANAIHELTLVKIRQRLEKEREERRRAFKP